MADKKSAAVLILKRLKKLQETVDEIKKRVAKLVAKGGGDDDDDEDDEIDL